MYHIFRSKIINLVSKLILTNLVIIKNTNNIINWTKLAQNLKLRVKIGSIESVETKMT